LSPLLPSVRNIIDRLNVGPLTVERYGAKVQNEFGGFDTPAASTITLNKVAAHNVQGRDLEQVPEADRNSEIVQFYTKERLHVSDGGQLADVITYNGRKYRIVTVQDYDLQGGVWCAFGALVDLQGQA
jgi:hypothetical protein